MYVAANQILSEPDETEENLIYKSLHDVIRPGINPMDLNLYNSIINDLFPKTNTNKNTNDCDWLREIFVQKCTVNGYEVVEAQFKKVIEVYEMCSHRKSIMFVGNPYTGKSFVLKTLIDAVAQKNQLKDCEIDIGEIVFLLITIYKYSY